MQYKPRVDHGAGNGESDMSKFKVGDVIESVSDFCPTSGLSSGDVRIVTDCKNGSVYFNDSDGIQRYRPQRDYKLIHRPEQTPPATITHEGYTYNRGERVVPEWVKDGAWVVRASDGQKFEILEGEPGNFALNGFRALPNSVSITYLVKNYRPHTPEDYKWGDWAMYEGKKVFVMRRHEYNRDVAISGEGLSHVNWRYVPLSSLTPTFRD